MLCNVSSIFSLLSRLPIDMCTSGVLLSFMDIGIIIAYFLKMDSLKNDQLKLLPGGEAVRKLHELIT